VNKIGAIATLIMLQAMKSDNSLISVHEKYSDSLVMRNSAIIDWASNALNAVYPESISELKGAVLYPRAEKLTEEQWNEGIMEYRLTKEDYEQARDALFNMYPTLVTGVENIFSNLKTQIEKEKRRNARLKEITTCTHHFGPKYKRYDTLWRKCDKCGVHRRFLQ
jgi:hypothetical protein